MPWGRLTCLAQEDRIWAPDLPTITRPSPICSTELLQWYHIHSNNPLLHTLILSHTRTVNLAVQQQEQIVIGKVIEWGKAVLKREANVSARPWPLREDNRHRCSRRANEEEMDSTDKTTEQFKWWLLSREMASNSTHFTLRNQISVLFIYWADPDWRECRGEKMR